MEMADVVTYGLADGVATLTMDDGKANALGLDMSTGLLRGLDRAEGEARVVVITGRPGVLCGGFDLKVIRGGDEQARVAMRDSGYKLLRRLYLYPLPVIIACTGHAVAAGGLMLLTADVRIGIEGAFKIGLNEVGIGLALPVVGLELARDRLSPSLLTAAALEARLFDPDGACEAGYLDTAVPAESLGETVRMRARSLCALDAAAFAETKRRLRQPTVDRMGV
jgi:enoyl-CoA hydratase/carnithine racemase